jgi:hypothetical protein
MFKVLLLAGFAVLSVCSYSIGSEYDIGEYEDSEYMDMDFTIVAKNFHLSAKKGKRVAGEFPEKNVSIIGSRNFICLFL